MRKPDTEAAELRDDEALTGRRKAEHLRLALQPAMQSARHFFDAYRFTHVALPEIDRSEVAISVEFLGRRLQAPLLISCMTGGTVEALAINRNLARAAERCGVALGVGSQRAAIEAPARAPSFQVRDLAPSVPLLANLGAVQLNYGYGPAECQRAVDMIGADALVLHLNALQEAIQPEGQCDFAGLLPKIGRVVEKLDVPVIVKEVGCGLSADVGRRLVEQGVRILDAAGQGGTSWARIEARRARDDARGEVFADWGLPTPESIRQLATLPDVTILASGGVRNGVDVAKALALGAHLAGLAKPFLEAAMQSSDHVVERLNRIAEELRTAMFCLGVRTVAELRRVELHKRS